MRKLQLSIIFSIASKFLIILLLISRHKYYLRQMFYTSFHKYFIELIYIN